MQRIVTHASPLRYHTCTICRHDKKRLCVVEAAIAWEVCASIHETFAKGKDALYTTRHGDFVKHADDSRSKAQSDDGALLRAADMLTAYAELIRRDGATHVEEHHYLPDVEFIAAELRARAVCVA